MTARDFCFWLQGYFELGEINPSFGVPRDAAEKIQQHLALVFIHDIDPKIDKGNADMKALLDSVHTGKLQVSPESTPRC
jgi:hypothetical protein